MGGRKTDEAVENALSDAVKSGRPGKTDETTREDLLARASVGMPNLRAEGMAASRRGLAFFAGCSAESNLKKHA